MKITSDEWLENPGSKEVEKKGGNFESNPTSKNSSFSFI